MGREGQEGLLEVYRQQKADNGQCGLTAEWGEGPGDKGRGNGYGILCLHHLGCHW